MSIVMPIHVAFCVEGFTNRQAIFFWTPAAKATFIKIMGALGAVQSDTWLQVKTTCALEEGDKIARGLGGVVVPEASIPGEVDATEDVNEGPGPVVITDRSLIAFQTGCAGGALMIFPTSTVCDAFRDATIAKGATLKNAGLLDIPGSTLWFESLQLARDDGASVFEISSADVDGAELLHLGPGIDFPFTVCISLLGFKHMQSVGFWSAEDNDKFIAVLNALGAVDTHVGFKQLKTLYGLIIADKVAIALGGIVRNIPDTPVHPDSLSAPATNTISPLPWSAIYTTDGYTTVHQAHFAFHEKLETFMERMDLWGFDKDSFGWYKIGTAEKLKIVDEYAKSLEGTVSDLPTGGPVKPDPTATQSILPWTVYFSLEDFKDLHTIEFTRHEEEVAFVQSVKAIGGFEPALGKGWLQVKTSVQFDSGIQIAKALGGKITPATGKVEPKALQSETNAGDTFVPWTVYVALEDFKVVQLVEFTTLSQKAAFVVIAKSLGAVESVGLRWMQVKTLVQLAAIDKIARNLGGNITEYPDGPVGTNSVGELPMIDHVDFSLVGGHNPQRITFSTVTRKFRFVGIMERFFGAIHVGEFLQVKTPHQQAIGDKIAEALGATIEPIYRKQPVASAVGVVAASESTSTGNKLEPPLGVGPVDPPTRIIFFGIVGESRSRSTLFFKFKRQAAKFVDIIFAFPGSLDIFGHVQVANKDYYAAGIAIARHLGAVILPRNGEEDGELAITAKDESNTLAPLLYLLQFCIDDLQDPVYIDFPTEGTKKLFVMHMLSQDAVLRRGWLMVKNKEAYAMAIDAAKAMGGDILPFPLGPGPAKPHEGETEGETEEGENQDTAGAVEPTPIPPSAPVWHLAQGTWKRAVILFPTEVAKNIFTDIIFSLPGYFLKSPGWIGAPTVVGWKLGVAVAEKLGATVKRLLVAKSDVSSLEASVPVPAPLVHNQPVFFYTPEFEHRWLLLFGNKPDQSKFLAKMLEAGAELVHGWLVAKDSAQWLAGIAETYKMEGVVLQLPERADIEKFSNWDHITLFEQEGCARGQILLFPTDLEKNQFDHILVLWGAKFVDGWP
ncbi:hypothetical protein BKA70DRAFT_1294510 [Coprinopsis sp. MPI-PUGE-AT-0042]|nr:hypothetical protein BKA70DRAFT_1294510 [Coprinopsis sp. MPI-PUGE-AT-0042]